VLIPAARAADYFHPSHTAPRNALHRLAAVLTSAVTVLLLASAEAETGNPTLGQRMFGACAACHSLEPNRNMTGPSLANIWDRQAGGLTSFHRYSPALKSSGIVWNDKTLDEWIADPQHLVPGNMDSRTNSNGPTCWHL
jgi:cytochrome c